MKSPFFCLMHLIVANIVLNQERKDARMIRMCVVFEPRKEGKFVFEPGKEGCKDEQDHVDRKNGVRF